MDQLTVDGIHVEIDGARPPVVLTHDGLTHSEAWEAQVPPWSTGGRARRATRRARVDTGPCAQPGRLRCSAIGIDR